MKRKQFRPNSEWVRYRDETWIPCRKRIYLYWYKFLKHAEESSEHKVDWKKYDAWGGKETVMNMRFDDWWELHWKDCFGIDKELGRARYMVTKRHKADGVRYALLCYENQHRGSNWDIAIHIQKVEEQNRHPVPAFTYALEELKTKTYMSSGIKRTRVFDEESRTNYKYVTEELKEEYDYEAFSNREEKRKVQGYVSRYLKQAKSHLESVSKGHF